MKKIVIYALCYIFFSVATSFAESFLTEPLREHTAEVGTEISYIKYKEPDVMEEDGIMYGLVGSYQYRGWISEYSPDPNTYIIKLDGKVSWGEVDYESNGTGTMDNIEDYMIELRGVGGYDFYLSEAAILTPFIGVGCRYLNDDMSGRTTSTGASGYERSSRYIYSPIGVELSAALDQGWSIRAQVEYDYFWEGKQKSFLSDADPGYNDITNDQDEGYGARAYIEFQKKSEKIDFSIGPFIKYWNIKRSDGEIIYYYGVPYRIGYEPKNNSTEIGLKCSILF
ncbi:MAG: autotransporter domain-containing protein [Candidatus Omnitrophota bacterium]|nr:MAG: autotransporter domain-containing protein [Candidatus Omnitrophota bacterium]